MSQVNKCLISQGFGANANPLYAGQGYKGHTGIDECCGYGTPIYALKKGLVYKIIDDVHPANDGSGYWAVFIIAQDADGVWCEWQVGHVSKILCKVGDYVDPWTIIAEEGNHGDVYVGSMKITKEMQDAGDHRGSHRHWNKKLLKRQTLNEREEDGGMHLTGIGMNAYRDPQGYFYQVQNYNNGYNGSVDCATDLDVGIAAVNAHAVPPAPSFHYFFSRDINPGETSPEVKALQQLLQLDGEFPKTVALTGFYGPITVQAVKDFQRKYGVAFFGTPNTTGYGRVGPKTRSKLNALFF